MTNDKIQRKGKATIKPKVIKKATVKTKAKTNEKVSQKIQKIVAAEALVEHAKEKERKQKEREEGALVHEVGNEFLDEGDEAFHETDLDEELEKELVPFQAANYLPAKVGGREMLEREEKEVQDALEKWDLDVDPKQRDPLAIYLREISKYDLLTPEQEKALTTALAQTGDIDIAKKLVRANLRLVVKIAFEYRNAYNNLLDLIQEGNIGLMKAVSKYDGSKGAKLSYYASWWIRSYILKFILDNFRLVKIGTTSDQKKLFYNLIREKERLQNLGMDIDTAELSKKLGVSEKSLVLMENRLGPQGGEVSLDRPINESEGGKETFMDGISNPEESLEEEIGKELEMELLKKHLGGFLTSLKERDRYIFQKRLLNEVPSSLQSIADEFGVSRERIRQVEERLTQKLKVYMSEFIR
jgi:RNA polymerase sigma-32 factor